LTAAGCAALAVQVREPRARVLSLYRFWQGWSDEMQQAWGRWGSELVARADLPLGEFLAAPGVWPAVDNAIVRQLLASRTAPGPRRGVPRLGRWDRSGRYARLRRALRIVEWSSRSDEFLARICELTGADTVPVLRRENVTKVAGAEQLIGTSALRLLERWTSRDADILDRLSADGLLARRSRADLDREFEDTADRLGFRLVSAPARR
jgi:hypothetical protein